MSASLALEIDDRELSPEDVLAVCAELTPFLRINLLVLFFFGESVLVFEGSCNN